MVWICHDVRNKSGPGHTPGPGHGFAVTPCCDTAAMTNLISSQVAFEVCEAFRTALEHDEPVCASCGHLADDHAPSATVTPLRARRPVRRTTPARQAS